MRESVLCKADGHEFEQRVRAEKAERTTASQLVFK